MKLSITKKANVLSQKIDNKSECYNAIMSIYQRGIDIITLYLINLQKKLNNNSEYEVITDIESRIKTPKSILGKLKKKKYEPTYHNLISNIKDIAGVRVITTFTNDIYKIKDILYSMEEIEILEEKDYIKNKKESGYTAYHLIVGIPLKINGEKKLIPIEIQIRTLLMDFWASMEHKVKYKTTNNLSKFDSNKLTLYAKIMNYINNDMLRIYMKQNAI